LNAHLNVINTSDKDDYILGGQPRVNQLSVQRGRMGTLEQSSFKVLVAKLNPEGEACNSSFCIRISPEDKASHAWKFKAVPPMALLLNFEAHAGCKIIYRRTDAIRKRQV